MQHPMADVQKHQNFRIDVGTECIIRINLACRFLAVIPSTWVVSWRDF